MKRSSAIALSFEVFPPNTSRGVQKLLGMCQQLNTMHPRFISVTFGAAGAAQLKTLYMVRQLYSHQITAAPHLTCVGMTKTRLEKLLNAYIACGVRHLVVIRGDCISDDDKGDFVYACDLIAYIRELTQHYFHLSVAAYPEFHPQCAFSDMDLLHFKNKVDAGADDAITQFFFNSDAYHDFREKCYKLDIKIPIIPGIMPIQDYGKLLRFSQSCGAEIPLWLRKKLDQYANDNYSIRSIGVEFVSKLCERLLLDGAEGLHFYTLNQMDPTLHIYRSIFSGAHSNDYLTFIHSP